MFLFDVIWKLGYIWASSEQGPIVPSFLYCQIKARGLLVLLQRCFLFAACVFSAPESNPCWKWVWSAKWSDWHLISLPRVRVQAALSHISTFKQIVHPKIILHPFSPLCVQALLIIFHLRNRSILLWMWRIPHNQNKTIKCRHTAQVAPSKCLEETIWLETATLEPNSLPKYPAFFFVGCQRLLSDI